MFELIEATRQVSNAHSFMMLQNYPSEAWSKANERLASMLQRQKEAREVLEEFIKEAAK